MTIVGWTVAVALLTVVVVYVGWRFGRRPSAADLTRQVARSIRRKRAAYAALSQGRDPNLVAEARRFVQHADKGPLVYDIIDVTVFAPVAAPASRSIIVQVFLHRMNDGELAATLAREADPRTNRRGLTTLTTEIHRGQKIDVFLEAPELEVQEPTRRFVWRGRAGGCQFVVQLPADAAGRTYYLRVRVLLGAIPVGTIHFTLDGCGTEAAPPPKPEPRGDRAERYRHVFLSYASEDREEVLKRAQALKAAHVDFFQDLLDIRPGDRWQPRIFEEIDRCDLFLLFWSSYAARSEWVTKEAEYALRRRKTSEEPEITPILIEGPPVPKPPPSLQEIHFNDPLCYIIAAVGTHERPRLGHVSGPDV